MAISPSTATLSRVFTMPQATCETTGEVHVVVARVEYERKDGPEIRVAMKAFFDSYPKAETQA
jgi:hypothetical protein